MCCFHAFVFSCPEGGGNSSVPLLSFFECAHIHIYIFVFYCVFFFYCYRELNLSFPSAFTCCSAAFRTCDVMSTCVWLLGAPHVGLCVCVMGFNICQASNHTLTLAVMKGEHSTTPLTQNDQFFHENSCATRGLSHPIIGSSAKNVLCWACSIRRKGE